MTGLTDLVPTLPEWETGPISWLIGVLIDSASNQLASSMNTVEQFASVVFATPERAMLFGILIMLVLILFTMWDVRLRVTRLAHRFHLFHRRVVVGAIRFVKADY